MRCWIDNGDDDRLDRAVVDGALTTADADAIREFREYLRGPDQADNDSRGSS